MVHTFYVKYRMRWFEEAGGSYVRERERWSAESDDDKVGYGDHSCVKSYRSGNAWINT